MPVEDAVPVDAPGNTDVVMEDTADEGAAPVEPAAMEPVQPAAEAGIGETANGDGDAAAGGGEIVEDAVQVMDGVETAEEPQQAAAEIMHVDLRRLTYEQLLVRYSFDEPSCQVGL